MILKSSSNKEKLNSKIIGVLLPGELHAFFSLYTTAKGLTKTTIVKDELIDWADTMRMCGNDEKELINEIIVKVRHRWNTTKIKTPELTLRDFKRTLKTELRTKGITEQHIETIIKGV